MHDKTDQIDELRLFTNNRILKALPDESFERIRPHLEKVELEPGQILFRPEERIEYVYFPNYAMVSVLASTISGQCAEAGVIGNEGIVGMEVLMGTDNTLNENVIQLPNGALRMPTAAIREEFKRNEALHDLILQFMRLFMLQVSQTALCNRLHTIEERLARWLLMCHDRAETDQLKLTQEFLGIMLGTNRATVTMSAIVLQTIGVIRYSRGLITITDRPELEHFACECYETIKREYDIPLKGEVR